MKGIPQNVIENESKNFEYSEDDNQETKIKNLYYYLYNGHSVSFNLVENNVRFIMKKTGEIIHNNNFIRKVKATCEKYSFHS